MKEIRRWRKGVDKKLNLNPQAISNLFVAKTEDLVKKVDDFFGKCGT